MSNKPQNWSIETEKDPCFEREKSFVELQLGAWALQRSSEKVDWPDTRGLNDRNKDIELVCIGAIGSNFVQVRSTSDGRGTFSYQRILKSDFWKFLLPISDEEAQMMIDRWANQYREKTSHLLEEVKRLSLRLGLNPRNLIEKSPQESESRGLALLSGEASISAYKVALTQAKDATLPELFKALKASNGELQRWLSARALPMEIKAGEMSDLTDEIKDKLLNLDLYAGLSESVVKCKDGEPAPLGEKLHVMQRRLYMDEECLAAYEAGGMTFNDIREFDRWLCKPENLDRILPFQRTIVAFRVRRHVKVRNLDEVSFSSFVNVDIENSDKFTFLYIRNGQQVWCLSTTIDFEEKIFPDGTLYDQSEPMMILPSSHSSSSVKIEKIITLREFEALKQEQNEKIRKKKQWEKDNPKEQWEKENPRSWYEYANPYRIEFNEFDRNRWQPFDSSSVYYDEAMRTITDQVKKYNRIATILQGLFDRSEVLHPHPAVQLWTPEGFMRAIELVFDADNVLESGEKPDFEAYRQSLNSSIDIGSVVIGQRDYWMEVEAKKEMARRQNDRRLSENERYRELTRYAPYGNPGPSTVWTVENWNSKKRVLLCAWEREGSRYPYAPVKCSLSVPADRLFNVSAYRPGDFKKFYADHRTRSEYLQWAPMLLAAEDWWASKAKQTDEDQS